jgi:hypothetical protein
VAAQVPYGQERGYCAGGRNPENKRDAVSSVPAPTFRHRPAPPTAPGRRWCRACDIAGVEPIFIPFRGDWDDAIEDAASKEAKHLFSKPESAASKPLPESVAKPRALVSQDDARGNGAEAAVGADIETGERGRPEKDANWHVLREEAAKPCERREFPAFDGITHPTISEWTGKKAKDFANLPPPASRQQRVDCRKIDRCRKCGTTRLPPSSNGLRKKQRIWIFPHPRPASTLTSGSSPPPTRLPARSPTSARRHQCARLRQGGSSLSTHQERPDRRLRTEAGSARRPCR